MLCKIQLNNICKSWATSTRGLTRLNKCFYLTKNHALSAIYTALENNQAAILAANQIDMDKGRSNQLDSALLDRLELTPARFKGMLQGLKDVIALVDPIGKLRILHIAPQAFKLEKCVYL